MNDESFLVRFISSKNCFLQFSNKWFKKINSPKWPCLKLEHAKTRQRFRLTSAPQPDLSFSDCAVGINATCAQCLGLQEGDIVIVSTEENITPLRQVLLTPVSNDDYGILELSRDSVEASLLDQIRVVNVGQAISIWVSRTVQLRLTVDQLEPDESYGRLDQMTELVIQQFSTLVPGKREPFMSHAVSNSGVVSIAQELNQNNSESTFWGLFSEYIPNTILDMFSPSDSSGYSKSFPMNAVEHIDTSQLMFRIHPYPRQDSNQNCCDNVHNELIHPFNVFIRKRTLQGEICWPPRSFIHSLYKEQSICLCRIESVVMRPKTNKRGTGSEQKVDESVGGKRKLNSVVVCVHIVNELCEFWREKSEVPCVYISQFLRSLLDLKVGSKAKLTAYSPKLNNIPMEIRLTPASKMESSEEAVQLCEQFAARLPPGAGLLVNQDCPLPVPRPDGSVTVVMVRLLPHDLVCWPLTRPELEVCPVMVDMAVDLSLERMLMAVQSDSSNTIAKNSVFTHLVEEGIATLEFGLHLTEAQNQHFLTDNILITGKPGSGKTRLVEVICSAVSGPPHHVHISVLHCRRLKGKTADTVGKLVGERLEECVYNQPAVLVLEDLQSIAEAPEQGPGPSQQDAHCLKVVAALSDQLSKLSVGQRVVVIATAESKAQLHPQLLSARGRHSFTTFLHTHALNKNEREKILSEFLRDRLETGTELQAVAERTEGCVANDLCRLADKALFNALQKPGQQSVRVGLADSEEALRGFLPNELLHNPVSRRNPHPLSFSCVGGLRHAKQMLTETIIWPTKYKEMFSECPVRLERGVLLYGLPGTGKTMLATALAGESGLNSITVKGPELLSKYIGASEEAVRNVFQKAQCAQPCILFFDEFDSLAPRRGHDSTGVTDRVVNQLLTALDGVEGLEGVWVVAAASRPDLLDPALLRPGRIGTLVHCPLPDQDERHEILQSLSKRLQLSSNVDLGQMAAATEGFTGADLQAVLFTAQIIAHDSLQDIDCDLKMDLTPTNIAVEVCQLHLDMALSQTSPSIKPNDSLKFQFIYDKFQKRTESSSQVSSGEPGLRVTLA